MTRYAVAVGERRFHVEVASVGASEADGQGEKPRLLVDGEPVTFELTSLNGNGLHLFRDGTHTTELYLKAVPGDDYEVLVKGRHLVVRVDPAHRVARAVADERAGELRAPMPGLVVEVQVAPGQVVGRGDVLVVQESMKMQMQLRAPCAGRVESIHVTVGEQVGKGMLLARVAEASV